MNNKALISLSFLVLFGVSACSTSSQKPKQVTKKNAQALSGMNSSSMRPQTNGNSAYGQQPVTGHNEQKRLAYNYAWQKQQQLNKKNSGSSQTDVQARHRWQQQQQRLLNQERGRLAQQTKAQRSRQQQAQHRRNQHNQQFAQQQKQLAKEYAAQQMRGQVAKRQAAQQSHGRAQQYAAQQMRRQAQQRNMQQSRQQAAKQYAAQQMRMQSQPQSHQYVAQQNRQRAQQLASRQQNQQAQYLAMLQPRVNTPPRRTPQNSGIAGLSPSEMRTIGDKIFRNESGGDIDKLVHWNVGENFASMGIGHFTWYPAGRRNRYGNTFPGLLDHLKSNGVQLPVWVQKARYSGAPWRTKGELKSAKRSRKVQEFQNLLYQTRHLQASYIFERAKRAMPRLVKTTPPHLRAHVAQNLNAVANTRGGWYALIDYVNFKGEGLSRKGGYKGQNWGLLQVLENMRPSQPGQMALNNFADSAIQTLERRVRNSNPSRGESRWMRGWTIRCNTYRQPFVI